MVRLFNAVEGRKGKDETGMTHDVFDLSELQSVQIGAIQVAAAKHLARYMTEFMNPAVNTVGLTPQIAAAALSTQLIAAAFKTMLTTAGISKGNLHEDVVLEKITEVQTLAVELSGALIKQVHRKRAESN